MRQTACLVVKPITVDSYAFLFKCTAAAQCKAFINSLGPYAMSWACYVLDIIRRGSTSGCL